MCVAGLKNSFISRWYQSKAQRGLFLNCGFLLFSIKQTPQWYLSDVHQKWEGLVEVFHLHSMLWKGIQLKKNICGAGLRSFIGESQLFKPSLKELLHPSTWLLGLFNWNSFLTIGFGKMFVCKSISWEIATLQIVSKCQTMDYLEHAPFSYKKVIISVAPEHARARKIPVRSQFLMLEHTWCLIF